MHLRISMFAAALALLAMTTAAAQKPAAVDARRLVGADAEPGNWMSYGRTYDEQRFSPLEQIDAATVGDLGLAWWMDLDSNRSQETTPLVIDGVMYVTLQWSVVRAVDAKTGALLWEYDPQVPHEWGGRACCGADSRGVAAWNGKIYVGTVDGRLVAIDAVSGERVWETLTIDPTERYSISGAPRVAKGRVLIGNSGADFGARGYVSAYDAETGVMDWRFYTVPGNPANGFENPAMEMAAKTWGGEWWWLGGGGTVWDSIVYDPVTDLVLIGVGNGSPWPADLRSPGGGDHLFLSSIVALDPDDGSYVWHYQTTPNESWDYTATQPIMIADLEIDGAMRRVAMQAPKNGFFYVLDAATGKFISAENYVPVNWASHVDPATGRPVVKPEARYDRTHVPTFVMPSAAGGHSWHPMSMSPETGLVYLPAMYSFWVFALYDEFKISPVSSNSAVDYSVHYRLASSPDLPPEARPEYGGALLAWDPVAQKVAWRVPYERRGGGTLATAGGLVFQGDSDGELHAYRASDGEQLWSHRVHAGVVAAPVSYSVDGEQYVAVAVGAGVGGYFGPKNGRLLAFKLGGEAEMQPVPPYVERPLNVPAMTASAEVIARGEDVYFRNCALCHGVSGDVRGGLFPDLRRSFATGTAEAFRAVVLEGALEQNGMRSFSEVLTAEDVEAARAYIVSLARRAQAAASRRGTEPVAVAAHPEPLAALESTEPALAANKRLVFDFWRSVVNAGHVEAADELLTEGYIQHSPVLRTGRTAFKEIFSVVPRRDIPELVAPPLVASVAEGNLVVMALLETMPAREGSSAYTTTHFNLFRIDGGRLAEHWHSVQTAPDPDVPLPEEGGPQPVTGVTGAAQLALLESADSRLAANKRLVFDAWREIVDAGREDGVERYLDAAFVEHDPAAASGREGFKEYFAARATRPVEASIRAPIVALVAEGDLVVLATMREHSHPSRPGRTYTTTWFDMFRVVDGRLAEHWDAATEPDAAVEPAR